MPARLLTARVREQPFSVVLLDEFEKAHPAFLDLLLQVMGEGRLTDAAGRLADFRNSVVILTSNLGAESFRQGNLGFSGPGTTPSEGSRDHFVREVQAHLRPELFNRIDRLVPFAPLAAPTIHRIARRALRRLEARDGIRYRGVALEVGDGVAAHLAQNGYDIRYGARPLLRTVERELLAPLADRMNRHGTETALTADVGLSGSSLEISVKARVDANGRVVGAATATAPLLAAATDCVELRRQVQALQRRRWVREMHNDLFRLEREQKRYEALQRRLARKGRPSAPRSRGPDQEKLARSRLLAGRVSDLASRSSLLEDEALQALYSGSDAEVFAPAELTAAAGPLRQDWHDLLLTFYRRDFPTPDAITLALFGEDRDHADFVGLPRCCRLQHYEDEEWPRCLRLLRLTRPTVAGIGCTGAI